MIVEMILQKMNLLNIVNGTEFKPDPTVQANAAHVAEWEAKDLTARLESLLYMEGPQKTSVRTLTTTKDIWDKLKESYEHKDVVTQIANLKKLMITTMRAKIKTYLHMLNLGAILWMTLLSQVSTSPLKFKP